MAYLKMVESSEHSRCLLYEHYGNSLALQVDTKRNEEPKNKIRNATVNVSRERKELEKYLKPKS